MAINTQALKEARAAAGLSQWELARAVDRDPSAVAHIERGRLAPSDDLVAHIARALNVDVATLLIDPEAEAECLTAITGVDQ